MCRVVFMKPILLEIETGRDKKETINLNHIMRFTDIGGGFTEIQFSDGGRQHINWDYSVACEKFAEALKG